MKKPRSSPSTRGGISLGPSSRVSSSSMVSPGGLTQGRSKDSSLLHCACRKSGDGLRGERLLGGASGGLRGGRRRGAGVYGGASVRWPRRRGAVLTRFGTADPAAAAAWRGRSGVIEGLTVD